MWTFNGRGRISNKRSEYLARQRQRPDNPLETRPLHVSGDPSTITTLTILASGRREERTDTQRLKDRKTDERITCLIQLVLIL
jgi:hypothetical protein